MRVESVQRPSTKREPEPYAFQFLAHEVAGLSMYLRDGQLSCLRAERNEVLLYCQYSVVQRCLLRREGSISRECTS